MDNKDDPYGIDDTAESNHNSDSVIPTLDQQKKQLMHYTSYDGKPT